MHMIDPEQERERLAKVYGGQTDEELEVASGQVAELTEVAREALRVELTKRGLYVGQLDEQQLDAEHNLEFRDLETVRTYWNLIEAELAKGLLDAEGIEAFLFDDNMIRMDYFQASALGGIKLRVDRKNLEEANLILNEKEAAPGTPEDEEIR
jgi:hypothetical protein